MVHSYAQIRSKRRGATRSYRKTQVKTKEARKQTIFSLLVSGLGVGIAIALVIGLWNMFPQQFAKIASSMNTKQAAPERTAKAKTKANKQKTQKPKFEFYSKLQNPDETLGMQTQLTRKKAVNLNKNLYRIQVGTFLEAIEAERLKASLVLKGFEAKIITKRTDDQKTLYRVVVGQFETKDKASLFQKKLEQAHIQGSLVIKQSH